jgi:hypothetical protein
MLRKTQPPATRRHTPAMNRHNCIVIGSLLLSVLGCDEQHPGTDPPPQTSQGSTQMVSVRYRRYDDRIDFAGKNIITVSGSSRAIAKDLFPFLAEPSAMMEKEITTEQATAFNGEIADEVHEFKNATQGCTKVTRLLLRNGRVIELTMGF